MPKMWVRHSRALARKKWPDGHLASVLVLPAAASTFARVRKIIESGEVPAHSAQAAMRECVEVIVDAETREWKGINCPYNWIR